jgi:hypothetical protein
MDQLMRRLAKERTMKEYKLLPPQNVEQVQIAINNEAKLNWKPIMMAATQLQQSVVAITVLLERNEVAGIKVQVGRTKKAH